MMKRSSRAPGAKFLTTDTLAHVTGGDAKPPMTLTFKWEPEAIEYSKTSGTTTKP